MRLFCREVVALVNKALPLYIIFHLFEATCVSPAVTHTRSPPGPLPEAVQGHTEGATTGSKAYRVYCYSNNKPHFSSATSPRQRCRQVSETLTPRPRGSSQIFFLVPQELGHPCPAQSGALGRRDMSEAESLRSGRVLNLRSFDHGTGPM